MSAGIIRGSPSRGPGLGMLRGSMRVLPSRAAALVLLVGLTAWLLVRAVVPALSRVDTDFPNYLVSAKLVAEGRDVGQLYDDAWFREQAVRYGLPPRGKFGPFPPPTALLLVPLSTLQPLTALRVLTGISVLCLLWSIGLLARTLSWSRLDAAVFVLLSGQAIVSDLRFGQPYILVSALCLLGYSACRQGRPWLGGLAFGLFVPIKYYPVTLLAYYAWRRQWRVVLGGAVAIAAVTALSIGALGWPLHETFLRSVLGSHLAADLSGQDPFAASFQSFDTLFRRLFVPNPDLNPHPLLAASYLQVPSLIVTKAVLALLAGMALVKLARRDATAAAAPSIAVLGILALLIAPATATYHFILLWLPVGLLVDYFLREGARGAAYIILGAYALIGLFPYRFTAPFEGRGGLTVLAYPRLMLLLALFVVCIWGILTRHPSSESGRSYSVALSPDADAAAGGGISGPRQSTSAHRGSDGSSSPV
jgi:hypothetical protein